MGDIPGGAGDAGPGAGVPLQGDRLADFGADGWVFSYSYTRQNMAGHVRDGSGRRPVAGTGWYDHQWGQLDYRSVGWDWLGVQLDEAAPLPAVSGTPSPPGGPRHDAVRLRACSGLR